jgi:aryl-alcohol dehydrogenase-like predicted oxidoreductase
MASLNPSRVGLGCNNFGRRLDLDGTRAVIDAAVEAGINLLDRRIERELLPMARTFGFGLIPWSPLAGGLLTGKYRRGQEPPEGARFSDAASNPIYRRRLNDRIYDVVEPLEEMAQAKGITLSQLSLAWVLQQPGVTSPIIGPRTMEQYEDNMKALDVEFAEDELKQINRIAHRGQSVAPFYEAEFGPHPYRVMA